MSSFFLDTLDLANFLLHHSHSRLAELKISRLVEYKGEYEMRFSLSEAFTLGGVFIFYTVMCAVAITFVFFVVPETKGRSLEEISKELKSK